MYTNSPRRSAPSTDQFPHHPLYSSVTPLNQPPTHHPHQLGHRHVPCPTCCDNRLRSQFCSIASIVAPSFLVGVPPRVLTGPDNPRRPCNGGLSLPTASTTPILFSYCPRPDIINATKSHLYSSQSFSLHPHMRNRPIWDQPRWIINDGLLFFLPLLAAPILSHVPPFRTVIFTAARSFPAEFPISHQSALLTASPTCRCFFTTTTTPCHPVNASLHDALRGGFTGSSAPNSHPSRRVK